MRDPFPLSQLTQFGPNIRGWRCPLNWRDEIKPPPQDWWGGEEAAWQASDLPLHDGQVLVLDADDSFPADEWQVYRADWPGARAVQGRALAEFRDEIGPGPGRCVHASSNRGQICQRSRACSGKRLTAGESCGQIIRDVALSPLHPPAPPPTRGDAR